MVNFTRQNLISRTNIDYGPRAHFTSPEYLNLVTVTFYTLLGIKEENADPKLVEQIKNACKQFVKQLRKKWKNPKVNYHLERFEEMYDDWLKTRFEIPYLDEISKPQVQEEETPSAAAETPGPSFQEEQEVKPPPAKKQKLSFLEKVII